ncbi:endo-1,4-beta-xylanase (glycosyl hydrolase family 10) [Lachnotalea glycerini]|uniref:Beta-xylanase n=1 Tax=Lachnotalea glycerini TaxID=1763509 RepID=A0A318ET49_9FIRM|nr:endo-1,4-beta-xylanase [Lachnotalea glycerini]PXV95690.1 endo-1,4-beta-xylanase (glycosyl hydrolase family 10) [Lachnotalea glycerini]
MNRKKVISFLMIYIFLIGTCCYIPNISATAANGELIVNDFETGLSGWEARGIDAEALSLSTNQAHSGEYSLKISNRTQTWHGATSNITDKLTLGETYVLGIWIYYTGNTYSDTENFSLQLQYNDGVNDQYKNIKTETVKRDSWTYLEGQYTIPSDAVNAYIYVESEFKSTPGTQDLMDFYIDDFTATPAILPDIEDDIASLKDVFSPYFSMGVASTASELAPAPSKELILKHYNMLTPGNELKPDSVLDYDATIAYLEENPDDQTNPQVNIRAAKSLLDFARDNNLSVRGHTLVWHNQTPDWFFRENYSTDSSTPWVSKEVMLKRMENYIKNLMELLEKTYPTVEFYSWDVVNEAVDPNTSTGMRNPGSNNTTSGNSLWMQTVGSDYIEKAFEYARKYTPKGCKLFYNDYNEYETTKSNYIYQILKDLKDKNLVDGMGMQSHWTMDYPSIDMFETAARKYASLGLELQLTELDISQPSNKDSDLQAQANRYKLLMNKVIDLKEEGINITAVVLWGITDRTSWLGGYPLLFDEDYKAKPAYYSIIEGMKTDSDTDTDKDTDIDVNPINTPTATVTTTNNGNSISQKYTVTANGGTIDLSKVVLTFTADGMSSVSQNVWCDNAAIQLNFAPWYDSIINYVTGSIDDQTLMLTITENTQLSENCKLVMDIRFAKTDWSTYETLSNPVLHVYYDGTLIE